MENCPFELIELLFSKKDIPLLIQCFDFNNSGKDDLIGQVQNSLVGLDKLCSSKEGLHLFLPAIGHNQSTKELKSRLCVDKFSESIQHTFLDYLRGGYALNFIVAIDFTASNGNPRLPDSSHYIDPSHNMNLSTRANAYQRAISEVGEVLQFYDSDKRFAAWGFGTRLIDGPVSHCFNLNGSNYNHEDGVITDLQETKDAIVQASDLPLSILIVGVGGADIKEMEVLDGDKGERLKSTTGRVATRDIIQFISLRDVQNGGIFVVQQLLAELPTQFLTYVRSRKL